MSTVSVTFDYVYFGGGSTGYTRQPRSAGGPGGFTLIQSLPGGTLQTGDTFAAGAQPSSLSEGGSGIPPSPVKNYIFAFMSVAGGIPSGQTVPAGVSSFSNTAPPPPVTIGTSPIIVLVVYIPTGGGGGTSGGSGAIIDSFDESTGQLFSDTFVSVSPDPGGSLTKSANVDGFVNTAATETIAALPHTTPTNVDFDQWQLLYPQVTTRIELGPKGPIVVTIDPAGINVTGANLTVTAGTTVYALAFYKAPPPPPPLTTCEVLLQNWNALEPKTNLVLLAYYEEKLSACSGPQYAAAVAEIKILIKELQNPPPGSAVL